MERCPAFLAGCVIAEMATSVRSADGRAGGRGDELIGYGSGRVIRPWRRMGSLKLRPRRTRLSLEGASMIDDPNKTDLLMAMLKESLPIQTIIAPYLASALAKQSPDIPIPGQCNVI